MDRKPLTLLAIVIVVAAIPLIDASNYRVDGESTRAQAQAVCPAGALSQAEADVELVNAALQDGMNSPAVIESSLLTAADLRDLHRIDPLWKADCYWYGRLSGTAVFSRQPPHLPPTPIVVPTKVFDRLTVVLEAATGGRVYLEYGKSTYPTDAPPTAGATPTTAVPLTPRPMPTLPDW